MTRTRLRWYVVGAVALAGLVVWFWFGLVEPFSSHRAWADRVQADIKSLARKRPPDVTRGQWEFVVGWTMNLHGNCGSIHSTVEREWRDGFAAELERRLQGPVTLADIDWIWDEYARHTQGGQRYSDLYRPTRSEGFLDARVGYWGIPVD